jgi:hypothetical protein
MRLRAQTRRLTGADVKRRLAIALMTLGLAANIAAQDGQRSPGWQLAGDDAEARASLQQLLGTRPLGFEGLSPVDARPRLRVALSPGLELQREDRFPTFSWSLEAWEMNTASLAHIQCARATRTIETFLVEDCRFVDRPLPDDSANLVQVRGRWVAAPGLSLSAGAFSGERPAAPVGMLPLADAGSDFAAGGDLATERVDGINMNVSFGMRMGQIGDLLLDLQVERYRQTPDSFSLGRGLVPPSFDSAADDADWGNAGQVGVGWRGGRFSADLTGQYQEMPYWVGEGLRGQGFSSFDIEFSWRAPMASSISVGISNVLDSVPSATASDRGMDEAMDSIYGRIPYVRYKHDL